MKLVLVIIRWLLAAGILFGYLLISFMALKGAVQWSLWVVGDKDKYQVVGVAKEIVKRKSRKGRFVQSIYIETNGSTLAFDANFSNKEVEEIMSIGESLIFRYYPSIKSRNVVYYVFSERDKKVLYDWPPKAVLWPALLIGFLVFLLAFINGILFKQLLRRFA